MNSKSISPISMLIGAILTIFTGIFMLVEPLYLELIIIELTHKIMIGMGILSIISYLFNYDKREVNRILSGFLCIFLGILIEYKYIFIEKSLVVMIGIYAYMNFMAQFIETIILYSNKVKKWRWVALSTVISFIFSVILILRPMKSKYLVAVLGGVYLILYGITILKDFANEMVYNTEFAESLRRNIRIRLPVIYSAFMPQKILDNINDILKDSNQDVVINSKSDVNGELEIFIHLSKDCANGFGHIDLCYKDIIYSYGAYDKTSDKLFGLVSDGVLLESKKDEYINYNINRNRHLISFELKLSSIQCYAIENKILEFKKKCKIWNCEAKNNLNKEYYDYTNCLYLETNSNFYKLKSGYFKTYFGLTTNCVKWTDFIIGEIGIDTLTLNGIITPGIYFNHFNNLFKRNNTKVIRRNIYKGKI